MLAVRLPLTLALCHRRYSPSDCCAPPLSRAGMDSVPPALFEALPRIPIFAYQRSRSSSGGRSELCALGRPVPPDGCLHSQSCSLRSPTFRRRAWTRQAGVLSAGRPAIVRVEVPPSTGGILRIPLGLLVSSSCVGRCEAFRWAEARCVGRCEAFRWAEARWARLLVRGTCLGASRLRACDARTA